MIWITSDLHLGHKNIIDLCNRPFENVEEMDGTLIGRWNQRVKPGDDVYYLGDFTLLGYNKAIEYFAKLNGNIHFIRGNHDKWINRFPLSMPVTKNGWVQHEDDIKEIKHNGKLIIMCHYPLLEWNGYYRDSIHLFGHVHGTRIHPNDRGFDVGVDGHNYFPFSLDEIVNQVGVENER